MTVVRCSIHKIPYNDENPRGCPACHRERQGVDHDQVMQELARATQTGRPGGRGEALLTGRGPSRPSGRALREAPRQGWRRWAFLLAASGAIAAAGAAVLLSGPRYVAAPQPPVPTDDARTLPVAPGAPIAVVFAVLGTQAPQPHSSAPQLARYTYGADLAIDAYNDTVYAVTFSVSNRTWRGLRIGIVERHVAGALALIGTPTEVGTGTFRAPLVDHGYAVYRSLEARPQRVLRAEVRPPNGCLDALVTLQPRAIGILVDGERRYAVVGREGAELEWVATQVQIVGRDRPGPYAEGVAC